MDLVHLVHDCVSNVLAGHYIMSYICLLHTHAEPLIFYLQDLWLPQTLHRREQHGSDAEAESAGSLLECPRHPSHLLTTQGLFHV